MIIELRRRGHTLSIQKAFPVFYRGELIGNLIPDLIVDDAVIVDPKVVSFFTDTHVAQMLGYLNITGLDLALLLNFNSSGRDTRRLLFPFALGSSRFNASTLQRECLLFSQPSTINSVKERGSHGALRSQPSTLFRPPPSRAERLQESM